MELIALIGQYGSWSWIVFGFVLLALELVVPGGVLVWLGASALVTGLVTLFVPIYWPLQFVIYGVLALFSIWLWLRLRGQGAPTDQPFLNRRADRYIGREIVLDQPIVGGAGRLALDDTTWRITGPDLAVGEKVRVVAVSGAVLQVEAA